ncbi:MAG: hypothetical protein AMXMBFR13_05070 [Phycisphaerae bacterium]
MALPGRKATANQSTCGGAAVAGSTAAAAPATGLPTGDPEAPAPTAPVTNPFPGLSHWGAAVQHAPDATTKAPATPSWPSIDGFEIRSRLGGDGQGDVYAARDQALQVEVAIKVPKSLTPAAQEQFLREARALARVEHANIVRIRSFGRDGHRVYFVMDVISGPNAAQLVRLFRQGKAHKRSSEEILRLASVSRASHGRRAGAPLLPAGGGVDGPGG